MPKRVILTVLLAGLLPARPLLAQSAASPALGGAAQARVAAPAAAATVKAGDGGPAPRDPALVAGDVRKALDQGASPADIHAMLTAMGVSAGPGAKTAARTPFPETFVRDGQGRFALGWIDAAGVSYMINGAVFGDYAAPGGNAALPTFRDVAITATLNAGAAPSEVADILGVAGSRPQSLAYVRMPNGLVGLARYFPDDQTRVATPLPGSAGFSGVAGLPTPDEAFRAMAASAK